MLALVGAAVDTIRASGSVLTLDDTVNITGDIVSQSAISIMASGDNDDYIQFETSSNKPYINAVGSSDIYTTSGIFSEGRRIASERDGQVGTFVEIGANPPHYQHILWGRNSPTDYGPFNFIAITNDGDNSTRWSIDVDGNFVPGSGSTYDIGASGNTIKHIYYDNANSLWGISNESITHTYTNGDGDRVDETLFVSDLLDAGVAFFDENSSLHFEPGDVLSFRDSNPSKVRTVNHNLEATEGDPVNPKRGDFVIQNGSYVTQSRGWNKPVGVSALDVVRSVRTGQDGMIDHKSQDSSLSRHGGTDLSALVLAQASAIHELELMIERMEATLCGDGHVEYC